MGIDQLKKRAFIISQIRQFFSTRNILEIETPLLCQSTATDPFIQSIKTTNNRYLQTSPEYAMKRLIAAGSGDIFQICKAFRCEENGRLHNSEFTMLEWYRLGFDHHALMDEMDLLLQFILNRGDANRYTYQSLFERFLSINPHVADARSLEQCAKKLGLDQIEGIDRSDKNIWLQLLMSDVIEPQLTGINFVYDYPEAQAALAKIRHSQPPVAERFEVYIDGIELANGFHELTNASEQQKRFENDLEKRKSLGYDCPPIDEQLLTALKQGLPDCAGVALGIDRLIMSALNEKNISNVISFDFDHA
jgi:lysyl-tRNA synthetase class 2